MSRINYDRLLAFKVTADIDAGVMVHVSDWDTTDDELGPIGVVTSGGGTRNSIVGVTVESAKANKKVRVASCPGEIVNVRVAGAVNQYDLLHANTTSGKFAIRTGTQIIHAIALESVANTASDNYIPAILVRAKTRNQTASPTSGTAQTITASQNSAITSTTINAFSGGVGTLTYSVEDTDDIFLDSGNAALAISAARALTGTTKAVVADGNYTVTVYATDEIGQRSSVAVTITIS